MHHDWWSAYLHVKRLQRLDPTTLAAIYPCDYCGLLHVGSPISPARTRKYLARLERIVSHPNFWLKAPVEVQEHYRRVLGERRCHTQPTLPPWDK